MGFKAVIFDLDGTLHDRLATLAEYRLGHAGRFDLPAGYAERFTELDDFGDRRKEDVFAALVAEYRLPYTPDALFADFRRHKLPAVKLMADAHEVLAELRRRGLRLSVLTNGRTEMQSAVTERLGLLPLIDDLIISEAAGIAGPQAAYLPTGHPLPPDVRPDFVLSGLADVLRLVSLAADPEPYKKPPT